MKHQKTAYKIYSELEAAALILEHYGLNGHVIKLAGEEDQNFKFESSVHKLYTFKISPPQAEIEQIFFQCDMLDFLSKKTLDFYIPTVIRSLTGQACIELISKEGQRRFIRMHSWVNGRLIDSIKPKSKSLLQNWGKVCAEMSMALQDFKHESAKKSYKWNPSETLDSRLNQQYFSNKLEIEIAEYLWDYFESETLPLLGKLRKSINHNDAHEHNVLVSNDKFNPSICGIIDFGDAMYSETVNELAISCAYAAMHQADPLRAVSFVVEGYHNKFPLDEEEIECLYGLIAARLLITVSNAALQKVENPDNEYLSISEKPAWAVLEKWYVIAPDFAHTYFRNACGLMASPLEAEFNAFISEQVGAFHPIMNFEKKSIAVLDMSVESKLLGNYSSYDQLGKFELLLKRYFEDNSIDIGIGGYLEPRSLYQDDSYNVVGFYGQQSRTIHLGLDIWATSGTAVYAPCEGKIYSLQNNAGDRNFGPTIILQHEFRRGKFFYSLYGHLSLDSLDNKKIGDHISTGAVIGKIGKPNENGAWPPHVHLQLILDMQGKMGDFPGVAFPHEKAIMASICPNPFTFSGLDPQYRNQLEASSDSGLLEYRKQHLGKSLSLSYSKPIHIVRGHNQYLIDFEGKCFLDTVNNVAHVGHEHPRVVKAIQEQVSILNTNTRYLNQSITDFTKSLLDTLPEELNVVHLVNSGSEANELALRMCEAWSGSKEMIAVERGYHGNSNRCIEVSSYKFDGKGGKGAPTHTQIVPIPDTYRGLHRASKEAGEAYAAYVDTAIHNIEQKGSVLSGFICEPIISCGGQIELPSNYLKKVYSKIRAKGGLCITDEVQVGMGRVGSKFWGFELHDVIPDIVTIGKPLGNGHPVAAVICNQKVAMAFANGMEYFNTFGGNPVSCSAAKTVLNIITEEHLQASALEVGNYLKTELLRLQDKYPIIGQVRGQGLFLGFELVKDHVTLEPAAYEAQYLANRMKDLGILMSTDGPLHNVIKIKPPMTFSRANANYLIDKLDLVFQETAMQL